jgi:hypothetical protein
MTPLCGCKSGAQQLRELGVQHARRWDETVAKQQLRRAACLGDLACIESERERTMAELTALLDLHHAEVLALINRR